MSVRTRLLIFIGLLAVAGAGLWLTVLRRSLPPPAPPPPVVVAPPEPAPPPVAQVEPPAEPPPPDLPPLPEVKLAEHTIHPVPAEPAPPPQGSQALGLGGPSRQPAQSDEVAFGPKPLGRPTAPKQFSGTATATGGVQLKVDATPVALFGIKPAASPDRCGANADTDCGAAAQHALAGRLSAGAKVSCHVPSPKPGMVVYAICLDANGVDLSGFLIAQGLALADTGQSYDYVGAENVARNLKHGLWSFR